jgi:hypothetical protein
VLDAANNESLIGGLQLFGVGKYNEWPAVRNLRRQEQGKEHGLARHRQGASYCLFKGTFQVLAAKSITSGVTEVPKRYDRICLNLSSLENIPMKKATGRVVYPTTRAILSPARRRTSGARTGASPRAARMQPVVASTWRLKCLEGSFLIGWFEADWLF